MFLLVRFCEYIYPRWLHQEILDNLQGKQLLVVDLFAAHRDEHCLSYLRNVGADIAFVPAGCTSVVQVMDLVANKMFKNKVSQEYQKWRAEQIMNEQEWVPPRREQVVKWVEDAWLAIPEELLCVGMLKHIVEPARDNTKEEVHPLEPEAMAPDVAQEEDMIEMMSAMDIDEV